MILRDIIVRQKNKRQSKCRNIYTVKEELKSSLLCSELLCSGLPTVLLFI